MRIERQFSCSGRLPFALHLMYSQHYLLPNKMPLSEDNNNSSWEWKQNQQNRGLVDVAAATGPPTLPSGIIIVLTNLNEVAVRGCQSFAFFPLQNTSKHRVAASWNKFMRPGTKDNKLVLPECHASNQQGPGLQCSVAASEYGQTGLCT